VCTYYNNSSVDNIVILIIKNKIDVYDILGKYILHLKQDNNTISPISCFAFCANNNQIHFRASSLPKHIHHHQSETTFQITCNVLSNITQPTLVIVGADDDAAPDSLTLAEKIPGSWLIRRGTAGHGLMYQHPDVFNRLLITLLENNK
jgi:pimeloyl-ACP methyl ester carboxylesterase